jgi:hypothetical protein
MSHTTHFKGPTSSQKKRRGGKYRGNKIINVFDFDSNSCNFGIVEAIVNGHNILITDQKTEKKVHCSTHRINSKKFSKGSPVVFSYINGEKTGEIISLYSSDDISDLCAHFKVNYEKTLKSLGKGFGSNNTNVDEIEPIEYSPKNSDNEQNRYNMDLIPDDYTSYESEEEVEVKYDRFGNTIEENKTVDVVIEEIDRVNLNTIDVKTTDITEEHIDVKTEDITKTEDNTVVVPEKIRRDKKDIKNARDKARNRKQAFIEY